MEMFHRGGTEEDEEADPECSSLEGDRFVGFFLAFFCIIGLEDHRVEEEREKTEEINDSPTFGLHDGRTF